MQVFQTARICEFPVGIRSRLRELTLGRIDNGMYGWTFADGSTRAVVLLRDDEPVAWAAVNPEIDHQPVLGVFVPECLRRQGIGLLLLRVLLADALAHGILAPGDSFFASATRWPAYYAVAKQFGLVCQLWE